MTPGLGFCWCPCAECHQGPILLPVLCARLSYSPPVSGTAARRGNQALRDADSGHRCRRLGPRRCLSPDRVSLPAQTCHGNTGQALGSPRQLLDWGSRRRAASPWGEGVRCSFSGCARPTVLAHPFFPARAPGCVLTRTAGEAPTLSTPGDTPLSVRWDGGSDSAWERTSRGKLVLSRGRPLNQQEPVAPASGRVRGYPPLLRPHTS